MLNVENADEIVNNDISDLKIQVDILKNSDTNTELEDDINSLKSDTTTFNVKFSSINNELDDIKRQVNNISLNSGSNSTSRLKNDIDDLKDEISSLQSNLTVLQHSGNNTSELESELENIKAKVNNISINSANSDIDDLKDEISSLQSNLTVLQHSGNNTSELEDDSALNLEAEVILLKNSHEELKEKVSDFETQINSFQRYFKVINAYAYTGTEAPTIHDKSNIFFNTNDGTYSVFENNTWSTPISGERKTFLSVNEFKIYSFNEGNINFIIPKEYQIYFALSNSCLICTYNGISYKII